MNFEEFRLRLANRNVIITDQMLDQLNDYMSFLIEYNQKVNLTSIVEPSEIIAKHFYDSVIGFVDLDLNQKTLADIGSGAGFPGMVLKIVFPSLHVVLIEPTLKRCVFLKAVKDRLGLKDLDVINKRAEDLLDYRASFDYVSARAVASFSIVLELSTFLLKPQGLAILLRGKNGDDEFLSAQKAMKILNLCLVKTMHEEYEGNTRKIFYLSLEKAVSLKYPRNYSLIKSKPLQKKKKKKKKKK